MSACKPPAILTEFILLTTGPESRPNFKSRSFDHFSRQNLRRITESDFTSLAKSFGLLAAAFTLWFRRAEKELRLSSPCQRIRAGSHLLSPIQRLFLRPLLRPKKTLVAAMLISNFSVAWLNSYFLISMAH